MKVIPYGKQYITEADIRQVGRVLRTDWITRGPEIKQFEDALAKYQDKVLYYISVNHHLGQEIEKISLWKNEAPTRTPRQERRI